MTNTAGSKSHIYGVSLGGVNRLYIGCARFGEDFDKIKLMSESPVAQRYDGYVREWDAFEIESYASESEASEALDFWRSYFRSLGFDLDADV